MSLNQFAVDQDPEIIYNVWKKFYIFQNVEILVVVTFQ